MLQLIVSKLEGKNISNGGTTFFLNPYTYLKLRKKKELLEAADYICIDGQLLCSLLRWSGVVKIERCSFDNSSIAPLVFEEAMKKKLKVSVVGSDEASSLLFKDYLLNTYPNLNIVYLRSGYFESEAEVQKSFDVIVSNDVQVLVVGMGAINQEEYLRKLKVKGWRGVAYTCGGFIHQSANKGHTYYPNIINNLNLRFLYRIYDEPKLLKRYTVDYTFFLFLYLKDVIEYKFRRN